MKKRTIDYALRSTWGAVSKMYNRTAAKFDSTMATGFALLSIDAEGTPSTALGPKMGMEGTSISRLLKSMEERGLIERRPDPSDGRGVLIHLTSFGREKESFLNKQFSASIMRLMMSFPKKKLKTFMM